MSIRAIEAVVFSVALIAIAVADIAHAQEGGPDATTGEEVGPVTVGVQINAPFVMKTDDGYTGMAIDLWNGLATSIGADTQYREYETVGDLVRATAAGDVDVAVTNLTVTEGRAQRIDFTQPWFDSGLRIMVSDDRRTGLGEIIEGLGDSGFLRGYAWIAGVILAAAVGLTFFDKRFDKDFPARWRDGFAESFYTVMQVATTGRPAARKNYFGWIGRIWQGLWLIAGIAVIAYITSTVTSVMTTLSLTNQIQSVDDLSGRTVGVLRDSVAHDFVRAQGLGRRSFLQIDEAVEALTNGRIDAIIEDAPILEYYAYTHPDVPVSVVGRLFEPDKYAFGLPQQSPIRRPLTVRILNAHEEDEIERLRTKYFGESS